MENKLVREKKMELEKKLESLRKKHEKEKLRMQAQKGSIDGEKHKSKFYVSHKLVKRLSSRNMLVNNFYTNSFYSSTLTIIYFYIFYIVFQAK